MKEAKQEKRKKEQLEEKKDLENEIETIFPKQKIFFGLLLTLITILSFFVVIFFEIEIPIMIPTGGG
jgi:Na+/H+ antiporter NhaD/arsenite permease-like protein